MTGGSGGRGSETALLALENVSVALGGRTILRDVELRMGAGEFTGLIGSNGVGKTTLLRAILGLLTPQRGRVLISGQPRSRRSSGIGYVPQHVRLDPEVPLRARDLVGLGLDGHRYGIPRTSAARTRRVDAVLEAVGARHLAAVRVGELSGGEQQRVLIAHALISRPQLLLLDEPLTNLDIRSEQEVVDVLGRISHEQGVAVLISTHDMNPLLPVMDSIAYVASGRVASGPTAEVVSTESLSRLYGHHVDVIHLHDRILVVAGREEAPVDHEDRDHVVELV